MLLLAHEVHNNLVVPALNLALSFRVTLLRIVGVFCYLLPQIAKLWQLAVQHKFVVTVEVQLGLAPLISLLSESLACEQCLRVVDSLAAVLLFSGI